MAPLPPDSDRSLRVCIEMQASDYRYDNVANTTKLPGYAVFNLYGAHNLTSELALFARINNNCSTATTSCRRRITRHP